MPTFKNTRPTTLQLPNGSTVMPGAEFEADAATMKNPAMRLYADAKYIVEVEAAPAPKASKPKPTKPEAPPADPKAAKLEAVSKADEEALLAMADGETDPEVMAAITARAEALANAGK